MMCYKKQISLLMFLYGYALGGCASDPVVLTDASTGNQDAEEDHEGQIAAAGPSTIDSDLHAQRVVEAMKVGWNLGNSMDSWSGDSYTQGWIERSANRMPATYETAWGNPATTKALIDKVKAQGFGAVRIPVTWGPHIDEDGIIDAAWMDRVNEIVDYVIDNDLYGIIDVHHDTGANAACWIRASQNGMEERREKFANLWTNIALRFRDYNARLLFEGFNEILDERSSWSAPDADSLEMVNELNQLFVDTVRATGGNNQGRLLVVATYAASTAQLVIDGFKLPEDTIENRLIVDMHDYSPQDFAWQQKEVTWTTTRDTWGTEADIDQLQEIFNRIEGRFTSRSIPVIIGEFGTCNKQNTEARVNHAESYIGLAKRKEIPCFWWDQGGRFGSAASGYYEGGGLINRTTLEWVYPELSDAIVEAAQE